MGFLGAIVPEEYGGRGVDYLTYGLIVEEIGRADSAMRTVVSVVTSLVCSSIVRWGTEEQKQEWLPQLCSGEALGCFGLTEPDTGSDAANQQTRAKKIRRRLAHHRREAVDLDRQLRRSSRSCSPRPTREEAQGHSPASSCRPTSRGFSVAGRSTASSGSRAPTPPSCSLDGVEVPDSALMGEVGEGFKIAMSVARLRALQRRRRLRRDLPGLRSTPR